MAGAVVQWVRTRGVMRVYLSASGLEFPGRAETRAWRKRGCQERTFGLGGVILLQSLVLVEL